MSQSTTLFEGERVLLSAPTRYLLTTPTGWGYNPISGTLTLTSQRIVFKPDRGVTGMQRVALGAAGAVLIWFPIKRVIACSEQPMKVQWGKPNVLKLSFDNDGREYFVIHGQDKRPVGTWMTALTNAKNTAPDLAYTAIPALKPGFELPANSGAKRMLIYWLIGLAAACVLCSIVALASSAFGK